MTAQLARDIATVRSTADKQLTNLQSSVEKLKDVDFHVFYKQLKRQAVTYEWPPHILGAGGEADLTDGERAALDRNDVADLRTLLHIRNAWTTIMEKCDGHQVESLLETCTDLRAREAMDTVKDYFHPKSVAGQRAAYVRFMTSTMANTHDNIIEWIATVRRNSQSLVAVGGLSDDNMQLAVLTGGLLPEFDMIKHTLDQTANLSLPQCVTTLTDYANEKDLLLVAKGKGVTPAGAKVFPVFDGSAAGADPRPACHGWAKGTCKYGKYCRYSHDAPGRGLAEHTEEG